MSIERFLAVNLMMDLPLVALAARSAGVRDLRRALAAALAAAVLGAMASAMPGPWRAPPTQLALALALSRLAAGPSRGALLPRIMICLGVGAAFQAGWIRLAGSAPVSLACGVALMAALTDPYRRAQARWEVDVLVTVGDASARFPALIDTGNRLREPLSGLPVMIVDRALLADLTVGAPRRRVAFGALGGEGTLPCFKPEAVWCLRGRRRLRAPEVWVAVSPTPLPGGSLALAPCDFAALPL